MSAALKVKSDIMSQQPMYPTGYQPYPGGGSITIPPLGPKNCGPVYGPYVWSDFFNRCVPRKTYGGGYASGVVPSGGDALTEEDDKKPVNKKVNKKVNKPPPRVNKMAHVRAQQGTNGNALTYIIILLLIGILIAAAIYS